ncbi:putative NRPS [Actinoplanes missouriensis 431]|uniref:Putative NRPS n=1 Tax=Actinoplanes missouriensis (strain ATCC 14538 / DSM 43046 / CBS 188.64 / JCM 3121 / NBRC 102363 / NCIMB 12654 / NRRL B-3342 / UNCC 431) TaxID=512565 RepID=I0H615_ACTM4|nr:non-ribosomal peptide synthetase [Actinoplanes missouriensis]BAL88452.1 putative NRPS [Actinoplanes missouriensis 431]
MRIPYGLARGPANLSDLLHLRVQRQADHEAFTFLDDGGSDATTRVTYQQLHERAAQVSAALRDGGVRPGDRAMLLFAPGTDYVAAFFGCLYAGVVAVPVYPPDPQRWERGVRRLRAVARDAEPRCVLTTGVIAAFAGEMLAEQAPELAATKWISCDELGQYDTDVTPVPVDGGHLAFLQYTSGSTTDPRGVRLTHANLLHNLGLISDFFELDAGSRGVIWLPPYHDMGLIGGVLGPVHGGFPVTLMSPMAFLSDPMRWLRTISETGATASGGPNFAYELCARRATEDNTAGLDLSSWQVAFCGAEPIRAAAMDRFAETFAPFGFRREALYPCYGLAEATLIATGGRRVDAPVIREFSADDLTAGRGVPAGGGRALVGCGTAAPDQELLVVDPQTRTPVPGGVVGEVWLRGPSVADGYWRPDGDGDEGEGGDTFGARLAGPVEGRDGENRDGETRDGGWLRTGDLGFLDDGELFVTGRRKDLIIIGGRNHYPQDVELTAQTSHPGLRPGGVAAFGIRAGGGEALVVVQEVGRQHEDDAGPEMEQAVRRAVVAEHDIAPHDVVLVPAGTVPKTSSGKIQRLLCRDEYLAGRLPRLGPAAEPQDGSGAAFDSDAWSASTGQQRVDDVRGLIVVLLAEQIRTAPQRIEVTAPLTTLGLDSLGAVELADRLRESTGVEIPVSELLTGTAEDIATALSARPPSTPPAEAADTAGPQMSDGQKALWFLQQRDPASTAYAVARAVRLGGDLDLDALRAALDTVVDRHEILRTCFPADGDEPRATFTDARAHVEVADAAGADLPAELRRAAAEPFDLARGPLLRVRVWREESGHHVLLLGAHHLIVDLISLTVLVAELGAAYRAAGSGGTAGFAPAPSFGAFARWQRLHGETGVWEADWAHWRTRLAGPLPVLSLPAPASVPASGDSGDRPGLVRFAVGGELAEQLRDFAARRSTTAFAVLLAAYTALVHRLSGQDDVIVGTPVAVRDQPGRRDVVGYAVNPVAIRSDLSGSPTFEDLLAATARQLREALDHRSLPFPVLVERLSPQRAAGRTPVFQTMFVLQGGSAALAGLAVDAEDAGFDLAGLPAAPVPLPATDSQFDLTFAVATTAAGIAGRIEYDPARLDPAIAANLGERFAALLRDVLDTPAVRVSGLSGLTDAEQRLILHTWNDTATPLPSGRTLHELVWDQAARTPDAPALRRGDTLVTYAGLRDRASALSARLRARGVEPGDRVAVFLRRGPDLVIALLAVLEAGAAYVPLDPRYPRSRTADILADSGATLALVDEGLRDRLPGSLPVLVPGAPAETPSVVTPPAETPSVVTPPAGSPARPADLAYVLFTSGSTGRPKGVAIPHSAAVNLVGWALAEFPPGDLSCVLAATSVTFDLSVFEIFAPLACGGTVMIAENALELANLPGREDVTLVNTVPSAIEQLLDTDGLPPTVRVVNLAGEPLAGELVERVRAATDHDRAVYNLYGPSETTTYSTAARLIPDVAVSVGGPVANTRVFVLDAGLSPVPVGVCGELFIGGAGVAWGYWNRSGLTAERFVPDVFGGGGGRLYRTGDVVRWRSDGCLEFVGRVDHQVKVRGFRIELGEVESVVRAHVGVRAAVVVVAGSGAGARLVGYVVPSVGSEGGDLVAGLREFCRGRLPDYMVPSGWVVLADLPLTPNGKVDRRALPSADVAQGVVARFVEPVSPVQRRVAAVWRDLLGVARVGLHDNFFDLGGHSLLAVRMVARLRAETGVDMPVDAIFEHPWLAGFADAVQARGVPGGVRAPEPIRAQPRPASGPYESPATDGQERLWFLQQFDPDAGLAYHLHGTFQVDGPIDPVALQRAVNDVTAAHHGLVSRFVPTGAQLRQITDPSTAVVIGLADLRALPAEERARAARTVVRDQARRPFALDRGPLLRVTLVRLGPRESLLAVTTHHSVADGLSVQIFVREFAERYRLHLAGAAGPVTEPALRFADYAAWVRRPDRRDRLAADERYWTRQLDGMPDLVALPTDRPRPPIQTFQGATLRFAIPVELVRAVHESARREGVTLYMATLAAWMVVLSRHAGQDDFGVGTPLANRPLPELESMIGFFANTVVIRAGLDGRPTVREVLRRVRTACLEAYSHGEMPFESLVEALHRQRTPDRNPLFQVMFGLHETTLGRTALGDATLTPVPEDLGAAKFDLSLFLEQDGERVQGVLEYRSALFDESTVRRLQQHFVAALDGIAGDPEMAIEQLPLLSAEERRTLVVDVNQTATPPPAAGTVPDRVAEQARRHPDAVAVRFEDQELTYRQLQERVEVLTAALRRRGVGRGDRIAVCVDRGPDLVAALLAVLACGAAYLPLDPHHPDQRLRHVLDDAAPSLVVTDGPAMFAGGLPVLVLLPGEEPVPAGEAEPADDSPHPGDLAYVIYTSGSTGGPKGVMVGHAALMNFLTGMQDLLPVDRDDTLVAVTTPSFDIAALELFLPLVLGMRLTIAPWETTRSGTELAALLGSSDATVMQATPATWRMLLDAGWTAAGGFVALCGGEALPDDLADRLRDAGARLWNLYGPTETTIWSTAAPLSAGVPVSVGGPVANTRVFVLDAGLSPVPVGVCGELFIGGAGVAWGYWNRSGLTAERFVPDVFGGGGGRLYRTGDVVRWRSDGCLEFVGRVDHQVKVRGFRIELGEVESVVRAHVGVRAAVVVVAGSGAGARLVGYVVPSVGSEGGDLVAGLREFCRGRLPDYMVPSGWVVLADLPLTPNGKVDRRALPSADVAQGVVARFVEPVSPVQRRVAAVWRDLLGVARVGLHDNFFDLGGHSLLVARMADQLRYEFGVDVPIRDVFLDATVEAVAAGVERALGGSAATGGVTGADTDRLLDDLARLSGEQFDAMLADPSLTAQRGEHNR